MYVCVGEWDETDVFVVRINYFPTTSRQEITPYTYFVNMDLNHIMLKLYDYPHVTAQSYTYVPLTKKIKKKHVHANQCSNMWISARYILVWEAPFTDILLLINSNIWCLTGGVCIITAGKLTSFIVIWESSKYILLGPTFYRVEFDEESNKIGLSF